ncbi:alpha/beta hydrolase [Streptomyces coffeae]|uniref:Alpha/beta fold hydrolase n=1 Tax=Streptomyces coffeae TaxID=621382 RepID=A0ABS1NNJ3_9ACTN|nr:alpha/beta fold hydrolase [Streptomyces coffeae]MBL1101675.1 alpha/beta fold hydrolase [Streptomyces coffeae]
MTSGGEARSARCSVPSVTARDHRATLLTADGVPIEARYEPSPAPAAPPADTLALVVAHGFTGGIERPALRRVARAFAQHTAVITFSFRGHGRSGGRSTVGDREVLDLAEAVCWARRLGHRRVATVGFSMGGSVVLRHAALYGSNGENQPSDGTGSGEREGRTEARADAVISVSAPARWYYRGTAPMRRVHWAITRPAGRLVSRYGLRTRIDGRGWDPEPLPPAAAARLIAPTPLLIVHGDRDPYFPLDHPRMLAAAADPSSTQLWIEPGFGHAETAAPDGLLERVAGWALAHA